eukprot:2887490-Amphidinium_carterae.1
MHSDSIVGLHTSLSVLRHTDTKLKYITVQLPVLLTSADCTYCLKEYDTMSATAAVRGFRFTA